MASEVCMDKGMFKGWTVWISNFEMQAKKKKDQLWHLCVECTYGLRR